MSVARVHSPVRGPSAAWTPHKLRTQENRLSHVMDTDDTKVCNELLEQWNGLLRGQRGNDCGLAIEAILPDGPGAGASQPFRVKATDGGVYWLKPCDNPQEKRVPVTEQVVARCGRLIGAPVCNVELIRIPAEFDGHRLSAERCIKTGIPHASADVPSALFERAGTPTHRDRDENAARHAVLFALHDWCWGSDLQWLHDPKSDMMTFSHDHGNYLPGGPRWSRDSLLAEVCQDHVMGAPLDGLDPEAFRKAANAVEAVSRDQLLSVLRLIPMEWPITDSDLEGVGYFLEFRRGPVAARLRGLTDKLRP